MSEWKEYSLGDIAEVESGSTPSTKEPSYWGGDIAWITPNDLSGHNSKYISMGERNITKAGLNASSAKLLPRGTVVFSSRAPIGYLAIALNELTTNQGCKNFVCKIGQLDNHFLYYLLRHKATYIERLSSGSTFPEATGTLLKNLHLKLPDYTEQRAIAGVLSSLDDKIELLRKQNETLEAMASALFSHWFVDFEFPNENGKPYKSSGGAMIDSELGEIPEGWKVGKYGEIAKLTMGLSPKGEFYNTDSEGLPLLNGASDFEGSKIKATKYTSEITRKCERGDIIFCIRATIGNIAIADKEYCLGRGVAAIRPNEDCFFYALYFLKMTLDRLAHSATGSVIKGLSKPDISGMRILKPKKEISRFFNSTINPVFEKLKTNTSEIDTLTRLRDLLLPKLMSGEIRVEGEA